MSSSQHPMEHEELMAFLDGELPAERAAGAAEHLKRCTECQKLAADLQRVSQALVGWEVEPAPSEIPASISSALDARAAKSNSAKTARWDWRALTAWPHLRLAAGLAVATVLVIAVLVPSFVKSKLTANDSSAASLARSEATVRMLEAEEQRLAADAKGDKVNSLNGYAAEKEVKKNKAPKSAAIPSRPRALRQTVIDGSESRGIAGGIADANGNVAKTELYNYDRLRRLASPSSAPAPPPPAPKLAQGIIAGNQKQQTPPRGGPMALNQSNAYNSNAAVPQSMSTVEVTAAAAPIEISEANAPMVIRTAELALTAKDKDFDRAHDRVELILKLHHGYVGELSLNTPTGAARSLTATLRVPSTQLEATLADLKKLGRVEKESQNGEEVTQQYVDLEARIKNSRNTEQRLVTLQKERTGKLSDVLNVETQISRVRGEIEQMDAQRKSMRNQVDYATVNLTISEDYKAELNVVPVSTGTLIRNAAVDGYRSLVDGLLGLLLWLLSWTPTLLVWFAVLFFPARYSWRRMKQVFRQRELVA
jgi:uncharacterized protein DUF4349/putative zinc finger protein